MMMDREELKEYIEKKERRKEGDLHDNMRLFDAAYKCDGRWHYGMAYCHVYVSHGWGDITYKVQGIFCFNVGRLDRVYVNDNDLNIETVFIYNVDGPDQYILTFREFDLFYHINSLMLQGRVDFFSKVSHAIDMDQGSVHLENLWVWGELLRFNNPPFLLLENLRVPSTVRTLRTTNRTNIIDLDRIIDHKSTSIILRDV